MKVNLTLRVGQWAVAWASLSFLFLLLEAGQAGQWRNPREVLQDPPLARLQQGRKELAPTEEEELQRYGYTGLEVMTYLHDNRDPGGSDAEVFRRAVNISAQGLIQNRILLLKIKYAYRDYRVLLTRDGVRPGAVKEKGLGIVLFPPGERGAVALSHVYLRSRELNQKREEQSVWLPDLLSGQDTVLEYFEWRFDQGFKDGEFAESALLKGVAPWREPRRPLLPVKDLSELPPRPQVRQEFWQVQKVRPPAAGAGEEGR